MGARASPMNRLLYFARIPLTFSRNVTMSYKHVTATLLYPAIAMFCVAAHSSSSPPADTGRPGTAASDMEGLSRADLKKYAASHFLGFYAVNGSTAAEVCRSEGVDLTAYVRSFQLKHKTEFAQANKLLMASGISAAQMAAVADAKGKELEATFRRSMLELANALHQTTVADGCAYIAGHVADAVASQSFAEQNPDVEAILMSE